VADALEKRSEESTSASVVRPRSPYSKRFMLANLLVVAGFAGVLVLFGFLVSKESSKQAWSDYTPKGSDVFEKAQNMVDHVAPKYRYGGAPIAVVQAQPLLYRDAVVDGIAFTRPPLRQVGGRLADFEPSSSTIAYVFCGQAQRCALPQAGAGEIGPLLQRESLELALYTFKYWPDVRSIVTLLPAEGNSSAAVFLRRRHLKKFLDKPLYATLPKHEALTAESLTNAERATINRVVVNNTFASRFEQAPNGRTVLLLTALNQ
jgi:hypothetical protein